MNAGKTHPGSRLTAITAMADSTTFCEMFLGTRVIRQCLRSTFTNPFPVHLPRVLVSRLRVLHLVLVDEALFLAPALVDAGEASLGAFFGARTGLSSTMTRWGWCGRCRGCAGRPSPYSRPPDPSQRDGSPVSSPRDGFSRRGWHPSGMPADSHSGSGGVAALNHRLLAAKPPALFRVQTGQPQVIHGVWWAA